MKKSATLSLTQCRLAHIYKLKSCNHCFGLAFETSYAHEMPPSITNMYGYYIVGLALQGITRCGVFAARAMPISNIDNSGKVPYYVTGPAKATRFLYWMERFKSNINSCWWAYNQIYSLYLQYEFLLKMNISLLLLNCFVTKLLRICV